MDEYGPATYGDRIAAVYDDRYAEVPFGGDVSVEAQNLSVVASGDVKLESSGKVDVKSTGDVKVDASGKVEVKSSGAVDLNASGAVKVKGTNVGIN